MKNLIFLTVILISQISFSQDRIFKYNSGEINCHVIKVNTTTINYVGSGQIDTLSIETNLVERIEYENGDIEYFKKVEEQPTEEARPQNHYREDVHFAQVYIGPANYHGYNSNFVSYGSGDAFNDPTERNYNYFGFTIKAGSKWYFSSTKRSSFGFQIYYGRVALYWSLSDRFLGNNLTPLAPGFTQVVRLSKHTAFEYNFFTGFNITNFIPVGGYDIETGFIYGAECNLKIRELSFGLEIARSLSHFTAPISTRMNMLNIGVGYNF